MTATGILALRRLSYNYNTLHYNVNVALHRTLKDRWSSIFTDRMSFLGAVLKSDQCFV